MNSEHCKNTILRNSNNDRETPNADYIDKQCPFCSCQYFSVSEYSKGPIADVESLIRLVISPQHVRTNASSSSVKSGVLSHAENIGMSVFRSDATTSELLSVAEKLIQTARKNGNTKAGLFGVLQFSCLVARTYKPDNEERPVYCVYDTAQEDLPSHGDIFQRVNGVEAPQRDVRRNGLFGLIKCNFENVYKFRDGALKSLAPPV